MIKAIIFDLGGVLFPADIGLTSARAAKVIGFDLDSFSRIRKAHSSDVMRGKISFARVLEELKELENISFSLEEILVLWEKAYFDILKPNVPLFNYIKKLKKDYKVALISNIYDTTARHHKRHGHLTLFDPCILSCEVGLEKPDEAIFRLALEKLLLEPQECVFIDDREGNCLAAKKLGFNSLRFLSNKKLFLDLRSLGVVEK